MATFVLVHGSHDGSWVWKRLAPLLRTAGHEVYVPTLTGLADRAHLVGCGVNLSTHVADVANLITYEDLTDVVLVGTSYAGMVVTGVATRVPERLALLVYLDAYVPEDGQSAMDLWPPERRAIAEAATSDREGVAQPPPPALFGVSDEALAAWIGRRLTPHPVATYAEAVPASTPESRRVPRVFVSCTSLPAGTPDVFGPFAERARAEGWDVYELDAGHLAMLTAPQELADLLVAILDAREGRRG